MQHVESRYSGLTAEPGPDLEVEFENEGISLSIPKGGVVVQQGWAITPLTPPMVGDIAAGKIANYPCVM